MSATDALIIVDPQVDFCPGGALGVARGNAIFPAINLIVPRFETVVLTRDWHPAAHSSFEAQGGPWPVHCVAGTIGARFSSRLQPNTKDRVATVVSKGTTVDGDGYSGFEATELTAVLRAKRVRRVFIAGIATDYCVRATALDAKRLGYVVVLLTDCIAAVADLTGTRALLEMRDAGVVLAESSAL